MTNLEETQLFDALRSPIMTGNPLAQAEVDEISLADLDRIRPLIEELERNAEVRGRFAQLLEAADARLRRSVP